MTCVGEPAPVRSTSLRARPRWADGNDPSAVSACRPGLLGESIENHGSSSPTLQGRRYLECTDFRKRLDEGEALLGASEPEWRTTAKRNDKTGLTVADLASFFEERCKYLYIKLAAFLAPTSIIVIDCSLLRPLFFSSLPPIILAVFSLRFLF